MRLTASTLGDPGYKNLYLPTETTGIIYMYMSVQNDPRRCHGLVTTRASRLQILYLTDETTGIISVQNIPWRCLGLVTTRASMLQILCLTTETPEITYLYVQNDPRRHYRIIITRRKVFGWLFVLGFNVTLTANATNYFSHML